MQKQEFSESVLRHKDKMVRFAWSYVKDTNDACDVVQDVLLGLWEKRQDLKNVTNIEAWCMTLVRNKSLDKLKRIGNKLKSPLDETVGRNIENPTPSPLQSLANSETLQNVSKAMESLPEDQKACFNLRDLQGYSYLEISEVLGISLSSVKVNIFRARKQLKEELETLYRYGTEQV